MSRPIRVLHCPHGVGSHPQGLARAERELGLDSRSVAFYGDPARSPADEVLFEPPASRLARETRRWRLLRRALREFDLVHFNFGSSLMPVAWPPGAAAGPDSAPRALFRLYARLFELRDLAWLKRAGKGVVVTFQGDDARQADYCRGHFEITHVTELPARLASPELDRKKRAIVAAFDRYSDRIYALNPDLLHVLPARANFLPYGHVDLRDWQPPEPQPPRPGPPRVVHAPMDRGAKGTRFVVEAIRRLENEGVPVDFRLVEGLQREAARRLYEEADLVVDQVLVGWYGGLAVEAMALGKPVVAYIRDGDLRFLPPELRTELPVIDATPDSLSSVLADWLTSRRGELGELGRRSRAFVERWHDPRAIAARLKGDYEEVLAAAGR